MVEGRHRMRKSTFSNSAVVLMILAIGLLLCLMAKPGHGVSDSLALAASPGMIAAVSHLKDGLAVLPRAVAQVNGESSNDSTASGWEIECADCPGDFWYMTDRSLVLDADGHPHIAYGHRYLYHAWHDGVEWHSEIVDHEYATGDGAALALDAAGYLYVSYSDWINHNLKYSYQDDAGWHIQTVDASGEVGRSTALVVDANGYAHISYHGANGLTHAYQDGSGWHIEIIDANGTGQSLALDGDGYPHVGYYDLTLDDLKYAYRDGSGWHIEVIHPELHAGSGAGLSLALDTDGYPHITCRSSYEGGSVGLMHVYGGSCGWQVELIDGEYGADYNSSMDINDEGYVHVSYQGGSSDGLVHAYQTSTGWYSETVDYAGDGSSYEFTSLALDGDGYAHIAYQIESSHDLWYAYQDASGWHLQRVDRYGWILGDTSLVLDGRGDPHISYYELNNEELRYAYRGAAGWSLQALESGDNAGQYNSLSIVEESIGIAYYMNEMLNYYHLGTVHIVDWSSTEDVGRWVSLALDSTGHPHISYCGDYAGSVCQELKYAYFDFDDWHVENVDTIGDVGRYTSMAVDDDNDPHISYHDESNGTVKYAYQDGSGWHLETVDDGTMSSLALDGGGYPHISYYDPDNDDLKYAYQDGAGWHLEAVDSEGNVGSEPSLTLDENGYPHISYVDKSNHLLKYAYQDGSGWYLRSVGVVGANPFIALDSDGHACIGFTSDFGLWYAYDTGVYYAYFYLPLVVKE
jgi:hypothetical protein